MFYLNYYFLLFSLVGECKFAFGFKHPNKIMTDTLGKF